MLVQDFLENNANRFKNKTAIIQSDRSISYGELSKLTKQLARYMQYSGIKKQDRVIIFLDNSIESVIAMYAVMSVGAIFIMANALIKAQKLNYILKDSGARTIITAPNKAGVVLEALSKKHDLEEIIWCDNKTVDKETNSVINQINIKSITWSVAIKKDLPVSKQISTSAIQTDLAAIIYTSGSTGWPKGVMSTHQNIVSAANSIIKCLDNSESDVIFCALPLSFDYGLYQVIMAIMFGGTVILEKSFAFPYSILEVIEKHKVTGFPIVPTMLSLMFEIKSISKFRFKNLRYISSTGAPLLPTQIKKFMSIWPDVSIYSMYGITECKRVSIVPPKELKRKIESVGIPIPDVETYIVDENGIEVQPGEVGELVVRGPNVMQGYWKDSEETAKTFVHGNYPADTRLYTGDYFKKDDEGFLYFVSRKDDMIKTCGERVAPKEIENIISEIEGVKDNAVIGVPDRISGQEIVAFIVSGDMEITENIILNHCKRRLEPVMVPKYIRFLEKLPTLANGKVDKKLLSKKWNKT